MPTGYTHPVQTGEVAAFPEFAVNCARAFGATIAMRDMAPDAPMTEENLAFDTSYHAEGIIKAQERLETATSWTLEEAAEEARKYNQDQLKYYLKSVRERRETTRRYGSMLLQVEAWTPPTSDHEGLKTFMKEQLESSIDFDSYTPERPEKIDGPTLQAKEVASAQRDIEYHTEHLTADEDRNAERIGWVNALKDSLATFEPVEPPVRKLP